MYIHYSELISWHKYIDYIKATQNSTKIVISIKKKVFGTSLAVQWLRLHASNAGGTDSIPGRGTKIPDAAKKKKRPFSFLDSKETICHFSALHLEASLGRRDMSQNLVTVIFFLWSSNHLKCAIFLNKRTCHRNVVKGYWMLRDLYNSNNSHQQTDIMV